MEKYWLSDTATEIGRRGNRMRPPPRATPHRVCLLHRTLIRFALEIFNNHFAGTAEQMGVVLRDTASSVNVKERLDFSCAIFTARGELVVTLPHIPHLGAMGQNCALRSDR